MFKKTLSIALAMFILFSTMNYVSQAASCQDDLELRRYIHDKSNEYGVPEPLICGVIECESSWRANAENEDRSCIGLMQINKVNLRRLHEALGTTDLYDPYQNVEAGIYMLAEYIIKYGDIDMVLMCYNCGECGALALRSQGIKKTGYSIKVQKLAENYSEMEIGDKVKTDKVFSLMEISDDMSYTDTEYQICRE